MRGGLVALGVGVVFLGFSIYLVVTWDGGLLLYQVAGVNFATALWVVCILPIALIVVGGMIFLAGLVGKSQAELAAMRPYHPPPPPPGY